MKKQMTGGLVLTLLVAGFAFMPITRAEEDTASVQAAADSFYAALNAMFAGDAEPMKAVWSHADDITYMGPTGGLKKGWPDIAQVWEEQAANKLGGKVTPEEMQINAGQDIAITSNYEIGENFDRDGNLQKVSIRATNVFRKENGAWKMIGHHTDLLPFLENKAE